jgi:hypothetical protein
MGADNEAYAFNKNDAQQLVNMLGGIAGEFADGNVDLNKRSTVVHAKTPLAGIPARSGLTMGSALCDLFDCNSSGALVDSLKNITVYNMASSGVAGNKQIIAAKNSAGLYVCIVEDCG